MWGCGSDGADGQNGANGQNGSDGKNGTSATMKTSVENAGENCANGGIKIEVLLDGVVQSDQTQYICNGAQGAQGPAGSGSAGPQGTDGLNTVLLTTKVESGNDCPNGGYKVEAGLDKNKDGKLDADEVQADLTRFVCNGAEGDAGINGFNTLLQTAKIDPGDATCKAGGYKIEAGLDKDGDGELDADEIDGNLTQQICNGEVGGAGASGLNAVLLMTKIDPGTAPCVNGGYKIEVGLDKDGDGKLDSDEIDDDLTKEICNGENGDAGVNGLNAISSKIYLPAYEDCPNGAFRVSFGIDADADNWLDPDEVAMSQYVCANPCEDGAEGYGFLESAQKCLQLRETPIEEGDTCQFGGSKVEYVDDANGDGVIEESEIVFSTIQCTEGECINGDEMYIASYGRCVDPWISIPRRTYSIMRTEVTVAAFEECVNAGACSSDHFDVYPNVDPQSYPYNYGRGDAYKNHPMNGVDFEGAQEYCAFIGGRLPTQLEWAYAASIEDASGTIRSGDHIYPWGTASSRAEVPVEWHCTKANYRNDRDIVDGQMYPYCDGLTHSTSGGTTPVGTYPEGASPLGMVDMIGNVREWATGFSAGDRQYALGGDFSALIIPSNSADVIWATNKDAAVGFRCVKDAN